MGFKDTVQNDITVFLSLDEFGELHNVDGRDITIVIDNDDLKPRPRQPADLYHVAAGVYLGQLTIYARAADFEDRPVIGQLMRLDDEPYPVLGCSEDAGVLKIVLEANQA